MKHFKSVILSLIAFILISNPLLAIAAPDTYTVDSFQAFQLEDGSQVYLITYTLDYTVAPNQTASEAWLFRMSDAGVNIADVTPLSIYDSGYTNGVVGIVFDFDDANLPAWVTANISMNMTGNPSLSWDDGDPPIRPNNTVDSWTVGQDLLEARIRSIALSLESPFSADLVELIQGVLLLTSDGENYFEQAIPNLRGTAPGLFSAGTIVPQVITHSYNQTYAGEVEATYSGNTSFGNFDTVADDWGISRMWLLSSLWTALSGGIAAVLAINMKIGSGSLFIFGALMVLGSSIGFLSFTAGILIGIGGFLAIVFALFWRGSP